MINYAKLKKDLRVERELSDFTDVVDIAVQQRMKIYVSKLLPHADEIKKGRELAEGDILNMTWENIRKLCVSYEIGIDCQIKEHKEQKVDWEYQESKRISSTSVREN